MKKPPKWLKDQKRNVILLKCPYCKEDFYRAKSEYKRNQEKGKRSFCSATCAASLGTKERNSYHRFNFYLNKAKKRARVKKLECNITADYLEKMFKEQKGKCEFTNLPMVLNSRTSTMEDKSPYYASIDRIDNNKGYIKGNVQFVCLAINYMRNSFTVDQIQGFIKDFKKNDVS